MLLLVDNYLLYIYREQWYKSFLSLNEKCIFENVSLVVVNLNNSTKKMVKMKIPVVRRGLEAFYKHDKPEADTDRDTRSSRQTREANNEPKVKPYTLPTQLFPFYKKTNTTVTTYFTETSKAKELWYPCLSKKKSGIFCANICGAPGKLRIEHLSLCLNICLDSLIVNCRLIPILFHFKCGLNQCQNNNHIYF